jgi:hypothetical protein
MVRRRSTVRFRNEAPGHEQFSNGSNERRGTTPGDGWPGATVAETRLQLVHGGELMRFQPGTAGRLMRMLTDLDPGSFTEYWLNAVEVAQSPA